MTPLYPLINRLAADATQVRSERTSNSNNSNPRNNNRNNNNNPNARGPPGLKLENPMKIQRIPADLPPPRQQRQQQQQRNQPNDNRGGGGGGRVASVSSSDDASTTSSKPAEKSFKTFGKGKVPKKFIWNTLFHHI